MGFYWHDQSKTLEWTRPVALAKLEQVHALQQQPERLEPSFQSPLPAGWKEFENPAGAGHHHADSGNTMSGHSDGPQVLKLHGPFVGNREQFKRIKMQDDGTLQ